MNFNTGLASIHAYLCADGYVIKNPIYQKHKYYYIGLRNYNSTILEDFKNKCKKQFGIIARIKKDGRAVIQNKSLYYKLTKNYSFYCREWKLPKLNQKNLKSWLRSFFDCEAWVEVQKGKSRVIGLDSANKEGLKAVHTALKNFKISSSLSKTKKNLSRLTICGKDDLTLFNKHIGFLHPIKSQKLYEALDSYVDYEWKIPYTKNELKRFINRKGKLTKSKKQIRLFSIKKMNMINLKKKLKLFKINSKLHGPFKNQYGSVNYYLSLYYANYKKLGR